MELQFVNLSVDDRIATIALNNPPVNALSRAVLADLDWAIGEVAEREDAKVVIVTGAGRFFAAGADIKELARLGTAQEGEDLSTRGQRIFSRIERLAKPVIAAINGVCLGGGLELAMACHLRIASAEARLGQPEINLGIIPGYGGTYRLPRLIGPTKALEVILTGDPLTADEALSLGLVHKVVLPANVMAEAAALARKLAGFGRAALREAIAAVYHGLSAPPEAAETALSQAFGRLCETADMREGLTAFIEKRQPKFTDR